MDKNYKVNLVDDFEALVMALGYVARLARSLIERKTPPSRKEIKIFLCRHFGSYYYTENQTRSFVAVARRVHWHYWYRSNHE